jgi:cysteine desulfurase
VNGRPSAYLDHNATAPVRPEAVAAMVEAMARPHNASSVHTFGRDARRRLEQARRRLAAVAGGRPEGVIFTSGGTEANNLALAGLDGPVVVSAIEHASVLDAIPAATRVPPTRDGRVDLDRLERRVADVRPQLVSVMMANNETGVIQPVAEAAAIAHRHGARLHVDAAQALGRVPVDMAALGADLMTLSAHKMGGPPGIGALLLAEGIEIVPRQRGGAQEARRRGGTENLPAILGWIAALDAVAADEAGHVAVLRDAIDREARLCCPATEVVGTKLARLPNTSCLLTPGIESATQLMALDLAGVAVSSGAACTSGKVGASHVLLAMGLPEALARCAIRVSLGWSTTPADVDRFVEAWRSLVLRLGRPQGDLASGPIATT